MKKVGRPPVGVSQFIGSKYFKLTIIGDGGFKDHYGEQVPVVKVVCDCGKEKNLVLTFVINKRIQSCGCEKGRRVRESHGLCAHPLYRVWATMKTRCYNKKHPTYKRWGGKGVRVCKEWLNDFKAFYDWCIENGWEIGLQVDKDIKANRMGLKPNLYSPKMCSIVTAKENANNRCNSKNKV